MKRGWSPFLWPGSFRLEWVHRNGLVATRATSFDRVLGAMGDVEDDAQLVHPPHHIGAERRQAAVDGGRGLDVAGFVHQVMRQLDAADAAGFHRVQPVEVAFQEVAALDRQHQGGVVGADVGGFAGDAGAGLLEAGEVAFHRLQALAGVGIAEFLQAAGVAVAADHRDVGDGGDDGGGHPGGTHRREHARGPRRRCGGGGRHGCACR